MPRLCLLVLVLAGCGKKISEEEFVNQYTADYCAWEVSCVDPELAVFDGPPDPEECEARIGAEMVDKAYGCKLEANFAELCLSSLADLACPDAGQDPAEVVPKDCEFSWKKCALTGEDLDDDA